MAAVGICDFINGVHETSFFDIFFWIYPEPALILGGHYFKQSNHYNLVAVALAEDAGKGKAGGVYDIWSVGGEAGQLDDCRVGDMHPKKVTVLKITGVEMVTLSYF